MKRYRDDDGDIWFHGKDGNLYETEERAKDRYGFCATVEDVTARWGPLTELDPETADSPTYVTRGELADALNTLALNYGCAGTEASDLVSDVLCALASTLREAK